MIKTRTFIEHNYRAIYVDGKTYRLALNSKKPIGELTFPEFYDVKVTSNCTGQCGYCYQNSDSTRQHVNGIIERFKSFFNPMSQNEKPFQIAFGGGEPTSHPEFIDLMIECANLGITPNYTTNGIWGSGGQRLIDATTSLCGGVAVSTHKHLRQHWQRAVASLLEAGIHTNLHVIVGDESSVDDFLQIYHEFTGRIKYFVLLPLSAQGRSTNALTPEAWECLSRNVSGSPVDIAFGANFHPYLAKTGRFDVSIYEPESMSAYLDLETMKVYRSSFSSEERLIPMGHKLNVA